LKTIAQITHSNVNTYPDYDIIWEKIQGRGDFIPTSYKQFEIKIMNTAQSFLQLGMKRGDLVGLLADNSSSWLLSDLAMQYIGVTDVPRGSDATDTELVDIFGTTESSFCLVGNPRLLRRLEALKSQLPHMKTIILMESKDQTETSDVFDLHFLSSLYTTVLSLSTEAHINKEIAKGKAEDVATIIFTSGTTGKCKGVMLTHGAFFYQFEQLQTSLDHQFKPGQRWLSVLPIWHVFERIATYTALNFAQCVAYSKPVGSVLLKDFQKAKPHWFCSVPRIWEAVNKGLEKKIEKGPKGKRFLAQKSFSIALQYQKATNGFQGRIAHWDQQTSNHRFMNGIKAALLFLPYQMAQALVLKKIQNTFGGNLHAGICAGGTLPQKIDTFFNACGICLLDGYGMTESGPLVAMRNLKNGKLGTTNVIGGTLIKVLKEDGNPAQSGEKGLLFVKGPQLMKGYFKNPEGTAQIFDEDGYLNTGDLVRVTTTGEITIAGRAKDTIVLSGGENLEPVPIENKILEDDVFTQAVVIGQDKNYLSALVVLNKEIIAAYINAKNDTTQIDLNSIDELKQLVINHIEERINTRFGFKKYEQIVKVCILNKNFEIGRELSAKQELKRFMIEKLYQKEINGLYA